MFTRSVVIDNLISTRALHVKMTLELSSVDEVRIDDIERKIQSSTAMLQEVAAAFEAARLDSRKKSQ